MNDITKNEVSNNLKSDSDKNTNFPDLIKIKDFQLKNWSELSKIFSDFDIKTSSIIRSKRNLIFELVKFFYSKNSKIEVEGVLEILGDGGSGFLRFPEFSFSTNLDDIYVQGSIIKDNKLKSGQKIRGYVVPPKDRERFLSLESIIDVEGFKGEEWKNFLDFDKLTAIFPSERIILENNNCLSSRVIDLISPLGKGQRGIIVAPPRVGKTMLLKKIASAIKNNNPEVELMVILLDERPEEVTDFKEILNISSIYSSTFDEPSKNHIHVADMVLNRMKALLETGKDVVVLLDSLTRLARAHNSDIQSQGANFSRNVNPRRHSSRRVVVGTGGISPKALERSRKFFATARNVEGKGSITILATCLIDTENKMDDVIFEEFKGTGNMEIVLDKELAELRIFPAIHFLKSGTRKDDLLYHPDEFSRISSIRKQLSKLPIIESTSNLINKINHTSSNAELLLRGI